MSDHESDSVKSQDKDQGSAVPEGRPKSGRTWKKKQVYRSSTQTRQGVLSHLAKTKVEKDVERQKLKAVRELEREMKEATKNKKIEARLKREEQEKRRMANEYKTAVYQTVSITFFYTDIMSIFSEAYFLMCVMVD